MVFAGRERSAFLPCRSDLLEQTVVDADLPMTDNVPFLRCLPEGHAHESSLNQRKRSVNFLFCVEAPEPTAARAFKAAVDLDPKAPSPRVWWARALHAAGDLDGAIAALEAQASNGSHGELVTLHGRLLAKSKRYDLAAVSLRRAVTLVPDDPALKRDLALTYWPCPEAAQE